MSQNNTWIDMRFNGLLAFYRHHDYMEIGVLKRAHDHTLLVALVERGQSGTVEVPDIPYLIRPTKEIELRVTQHRPGIENHLNESNLLHFDGPDFHYGTQTCKSDALKPGITISDGNFVGVNPYCYQVIRTDHVKGRSVVSDPVRKMFAFGVRATIDRMAGRVAILRCGDGEMTLNQNSNYTLYVNNSPPRITSHNPGHHFQLYYEAFDQISTPKFDIRGPGTPSCSDPIPEPASGHGPSPMYTYQRPCLGIHLTQSEPK